MRFWKEGAETKLERELRAERPEASDEFVRRLSRQVTPPARRLALPKVALVGAVTAALAASLGAAGALGAGGTAVHAFTLSVGSLVSPPKLTWAPAKPSSPAAQPTQSSSTPITSGSTNTVSSSNKTKGDDGDDNPYKHQYGHKIKICWHGQIIEISSSDLFWYLTHGGRPPGLCLRWAPYPRHP